MRMLTNQPRGNQNMKTKFYAVLASAALIAQAQAGGNRGGGGNMGGHFAAARPAAAGGSVAQSFHSMPMRNVGGGGMIYSGQRFPSVGMRSPSAAAFRQPYINSNRGAPVQTRQSTRGTFDRGDRLTRFSNGTNHAITTDSRRQGNTASRIGGATNLPSNWRNHVVAQHSGNWQRNWDRNRDHWWHGHHCRFINGSWFVFDLGFDPWWPYWGYPYDYYAYGYDPYGYEGADYYDQNGYADQNIDSTVAAAQERLAQQGYYRAKIDGVFGPETRRAIARYQNNHGLRVTGYLTTDTLRDLGLRRS
jgi:hypothetical protein